MRCKYKVLDKNICSLCAPSPRIVLQVTQIVWRHNDKFSYPNSGSVLEIFAYKSKILSNQNFVFELFLCMACAIILDSESSEEVIGSTILCFFSSYVHNKH